MIFTKTPLENAYLIDLDKREDDRGFFSRYFCKNEFELHGLSTNWVQINNSFSKNVGTLRGLHFQYPPHQEDKLVRCLKGAIWDVIVDIRKDSLTFRKWFCAELNSKNRTMMYIPKGFAHGFQVLKPNSEILYFHSAFYSKEFEGGLRFDDPLLGIKWPIEVTYLSLRDQSHPFLSPTFKGIEL